MQRGDPKPTDVRFYQDDYKCCFLVSKAFKLTITPMKPFRTTDFKGPFRKGLSREQPAKRSLKHKAPGCGGGKYDGGTVDGCEIHFAPLGNHGKPWFVGNYRGIILPGFLRWCRISSLHSREHVTQCFSESARCVRPVFPPAPQRVGQTRSRHMGPSEVPVLLQGVQGQKTLLFGEIAKHIESQL